MAKEHKLIPVEAAEKIAKEYGMKQVIILAIDEKMTHITSCGSDEQLAGDAAVTGVYLLSCLGVTIED